MDNISCESPGDRLLSYEEALDGLMAIAHPIQDSETVTLDEALGRVLAAPVISSVDVPPLDNSSMDGYALAAAEVNEAGRVLPVSQRIPAGTVGTRLQAGSVARIFTGAPIPPGADTVVMQERCTVDGDKVRIDTAVEAGQNVRKRGEDIALGDAVLEPGIKLQAQHLGLAASVGVDRLQVRRRLRVALLTSGDEIVMPGQPIAPGQIYNSNRFTGVGLLHASGCEVVMARTMGDSLEETLAALREAAGKADFILATGGVSVGEEDHVKPAIEQLGALSMWKIAIRPGKPVAVGNVAGIPIIGTPGNPVSLYVTYLLFALPFIRCLQGRTDGIPQPVQAIADFDWPRPDKRREFMRVRMRTDDTGRILLEPHPSRSSGVLSSVTWADGLAVIPEGQALRRGDPVPFLEFSRLLA